MGELQMGMAEGRFADMIWEREPVSSGELASRCALEFRWKKSTTYTVLKRLCEKGIFQNENGVVTSRISREEFYALQSEQFVQETFSGSLPAFLAAFGSRKKLTEAEAAELKGLIDGMKE